MDGEKAIIAQVMAWVQVVARGLLKSWHGYFTLPHGSYVSVGGPFRMNAADGRSGDIIITKMRMGSHRDTQVQFDGTGPFA